MNGKGFATVLSLCLILVTALVVRGIQETERNHAYESADFAAELKLQNLAESELIATVERISEEIRGGTIRLTAGTNGSRNQKPLGIKTFRKTPYGTITVRTWGEWINVHQYDVIYGADDDDSKKNIAISKTDPTPSYFFFTVAQATNKQTGGKIFRRAAAYVLCDKEGNISDTTIHYLDVKQSSYEFAD